MRRFFDEFIEHFIGDVLDHVGSGLLDQPGEDHLLVQEVAVVETGDLVLEINQCGNDVDAVLSGHAVVVDLDEADRLAVADFVDLLQLGQDLMRLVVVVVICQQSNHSKLD